MSAQVTTTGSARALTRSRPRRQTAGRWAIICAVVAAGCALAGVAPALAMPAAGSRAVEVLPPAGATPNPGAVLGGVSCATAAACSGGGEYNALTGGDLAMVASKSGGRWSRAIELRLPTDHATTPSAFVASVSCTGAGACIAVGSYQTLPVSAGSGLVATQSHGRWSRAIKPQPPANAERGASNSLFGVSCHRAGSCLSVGIYVTTKSQTQAMAVGQSKGTWRRGTEILPPKNAAANPISIPRAVFCTGTGACTAVGTYENPVSDAFGEVATESRGRWSRAVELPFPPGALTNPDVVISAVTCSSPSSCVISGSYRNSAGRQAMIITGSGTHWHAIAIKSPAGAPANPAANLASVACTGAGTCQAVGSYDNAGMQLTAMVATETHGRWHAATNFASLPRGAATGNLASSQLFSVTCLARRTCTAVGNYVTKARTLEAMAATLPLP